MTQFNFDFDISALVIYSLTCFQFFRKKHIHDGQTTYFICLLVSGILAPLINIPACITIQNHAPEFLVILLNSFYYVILQTITFFFCIYVISNVKMTEKATILTIIAFFIPLLTVIVMIGINAFNGFIFSYKNGIWVVSKYRNFLYYTFVLYFIWGLFYIIHKRKHYTKEQKALIFVILTINLAVEFIRLYKPELQLNSLSVSVSIFLLYSYIIKNESHIISYTGMANRRYLASRCGKMIVNNFPFTSILIRVADYDNICNTYGMLNSEKLMYQIAINLGHYVKTGSSFQVNNSTFVLNFFKNNEDPYNKDQIDLILKEIYLDINHPYIVDNVEISCTFYLTAMSFPTDVSDMENYRAYLSYFQKMTSIKTGIIPLSELHVRNRIREQKIIRAIEDGLVNNHFYLKFQPIWHPSTKRFTSCEALLRLNDPVLGEITSSEFIPLAESTGTIIQVDIYVFDQVCQFIKNHNLQEMGLEYIEMNFSTVICLQSDFIPMIKQIVSKHKINPSQICIEITETACNYNPAVFNKNLEELTDLGFKLALDDFGTGYSSIQRMLNTKFNIIKIDKTLKDKLFEERSLHETYTSLQEIFHAMKATVVIEGVETQPELDFFVQQGADYIQGFYFSKPLIETEFCLYLENYYRNLLF